MGMFNIYIINLELWDHYHLLDPRASILSAPVTDIWVISGMLLNMATGTDMIFTLILNCMYERVSLIQWSMLLVSIERRSNFILPAYIFSSSLYLPSSNTKCATWTRIKLNGEVIWAWQYVRSRVSLAENSSCVLSSINLPCHYPVASFPCPLSALFVHL